MTPHDHSTYVPGCYRCELSRDEAHAAVADERDELLAALTEARDDMADLLRHHTRAIWALRDDTVDYPEDERSDTGRRGQAALAKLDKALDR